MTLRHVLVGLAALIGAAVLGIEAAPVTEQQAQMAAVAAVASYSDAKGVKSSTAAAPARHVDKTTALYHNGTRVGSVVSWKEGGFALMATDDELPPCKLSADHGKIDELPPALLKIVRLEMLQDLQALDGLHANSKTANPKFHEQWNQLLAGTATNSGALGVSGTLLLTSTWNQDWPYNYYAPAASYGPGGKAYAGCVACAMAQILHYHGQPAMVTRDFSYYDDKGFCTGMHRLSDAGLTNYDWADMPDSISAYSPSVQQRAIGQLIYQAGVAVESDFEADGTGADPSVISGAFQNYFGFNSGVLEDKSAYTTTAWYNKIAADIDAHRPVLYGMWQADWSDGHAVVCDGYRNGNEIHLNLGWSGVDNAWYNIDTVEAEGIVWTIHSAVFGITPPNGIPANDQCFGAIALANGVTFNMKTAAATSTADPVPGCASAGNGVWYKVTPTSTGPVTVTTCGSDYDTVLAVYSGTCSALTAITCNDDAGNCGTGSTVAFDATAYATYYILAAGKSAASGNLQISASWVVPAPANDQCSGAIPLSNGGGAFCDTSYATSMGDPAPSCVPSAANGVWYQVTPNATAAVVISTCGSDFDTVLSVYTGACGSFTQIACNDDDSNCGTTASRVTFPADPGATYYILVSGYGGATGNLQITAQWTVAAPLANDQCNGAIALTNGQALSVRTWAATSTNDPTPSCVANCGKGIWYKITPDSDRPVTVSSCGSDFNTVLGVYSGSCGALTEVACNDNGTSGCAAGTSASLVTFVPSPGTTYYIFVAGVNGASGNLKLSVSWGPANDLFDFGTVVSGTLVSVQGSNIGATAEPGEPNHAGVSSGRSVWWTWTAPSNVLTVISTAGSSFDTVLAVYTGDSVNALTLVAANDDASGVTYSSRVKFNAAAGTVYHIAVDSSSAQCGSIALILNAGNPAFAARKAVYNGLFYSKDGAGFPSAGFITIATTANGTLSGKAFIAGKSHSFSGYFTGTGSSDPFIAQSGYSSYAMHLQIDPFDPDIMTGQIADKHFAADIYADRATFSAVTNPSPVTGKYTVALPATANSPLQPGGDGFAIISVNAAGGVTIAGALADGTKITQRGVLSKTAQFPFYCSPYAGSGSILGWLKFEDVADDDLAGTVNWFKLPVSTAKLYPAGFTNEMNAFGSRYQYQAGGQILNLQNGWVNVAGGALADGFTNQVILDGTKVVNESANKLTLSVAASSGLFTGSAVNPATGKTIPLKGVVLQKQNLGCGYFTLTNQSGCVYIGQ